MFPRNFPRHRPPSWVSATFEARRLPRGAAGPGAAGASPGERLELRTPRGGGSEMEYGEIMRISCFSHVFSNLGGLWMPMFSGFKLRIAIFGYYIYFLWDRMGIHLGYAYN